MTVESFKEYVKSRKPLNTKEIHCFMGDMSSGTRHLALRLGAPYYTPAKVRNSPPGLFRNPVSPILRVLPSFCTDSRKNIVIGGDVFIDACYHFQSHGGITIGSSYQIEYNVIFVTLDRELAPEDHRTTYPAPIVLGKNVWVGVDAMILPSVMVGDSAVTAVRTVVTRDVPPDVIVGGIPAKFTKSIASGQS